MLSLLFVVALVAVPQEPVRPPTPAKPPTIQDVRFLAGCWTSTRLADDTHEYWFDAGADALIGMGRTVKAGKLASYEFMVIRATPVGLAFTAKPSGQPEATFVARSAGANDITFENPSHDFPQRVRYRLNGDALSARVEGTENGKRRGVDFALRRTACPDQK